MSNRAETGNMKFGNDWRGVFIRGDNAIMYYLPALMQVKAAYECGELKMQFMDFITINNLIKLLSQSDEGYENKEEQVLKDFEDCKKD